MATTCWRSCILYPSISRRKPGPCPPCCYEKQIAIGELKWPTKMMVENILNNGHSNMYKRGSICIYIYIQYLCVFNQIHILYTFIKNDGFAFYIMVMFNCQRVAMWLVITPHLLFSSVAAHPFWGTTSFYLCCLKLEILWCSNIPCVDVRRFPWTPISVLKQNPLQIPPLMLEIPTSQSVPDKITRWIPVLLVNQPHHITIKLSKK